MTFEMFLLCWFSFGLLGGILSYAGGSISARRMHTKHNWNKPIKSLFWMSVFGCFSCFVGLIIFLLALFSSRARYEKEIERLMLEAMKNAANLQLRTRNLRRVTRIEVNAALHTLMYEYTNPVDAMHTVIAFAYGFGISSSMAKERKEDLREDSVIEGHTPEHGNISINHHEADDDSANELEMGKKARVGQFRVWKCRTNLIAFHHFWAAEESTRHHDQERARALYVQFDEETLEPQCLAGTKEELWFRFLGHTIYKVTLDALWGKADESIGLVDCRIR